MVPRNSSLLKMSRSMLRPNDMLVAPMKTILVVLAIAVFLSFQSRPHAWRSASAFIAVIARGQFVVDAVLDRHRAEIGILAVEAAFRRLVGVLEPVIADDVRLAQRRADVGRKAAARSACVATIGPAPPVLGRPESAARKENSPIRHGLPAAA